MLLALGIASILTLIPYIYRAQQTIVKIVILFLDISHKEIVDKIENYEKMKNQINAHFTQIKNFFNETKFGVEQPRNDEKIEIKVTEEEAKIVPEVHPPDEEGKIEVNNTENESENLDKKNKKKGISARRYLTL